MRYSHHEVVAHKILDNSCGIVCSYLPGCQHPLNVGAPATWPRRSRIRLNSWTLLDFYARDGYSVDRKIVGLIGDAMPLARLVCIEQLKNATFPRPLPWFSPPKENNSSTRQSFSVLITTNCDIILQGKITMSRKVWQGTQIASSSMKSRICCCYNRAGSHDFKHMAKAAAYDTYRVILQFRLKVYDTALASESGSTGTDEDAPRWLTITSRDSLISLTNHRSWPTCIQFRKSRLPILPTLPEPGVEIGPPRSALCIVKSHDPILPSIY